MDYDTFSCVLFVEMSSCDSWLKHDTQQLWRKHEDYTNSYIVQVLMFFCHLISSTGDHFFYLYNNKIWFACFTLFPWQFVYFHYCDAWKYHSHDCNVKKIVFKKVFIHCVCIYFTLKKYSGIRFIYLNCIWYFHLFGLQF